MEQRSLLFVYGTLMRGERSHGYLGDAELVGRDRTEAAFTLVRVGWYPAMCDGESTGDTSDDGHTEAPPESSDPTTSSGGTLSLSCGSEWFDAPDDGAGFWVTLADGSMAEGYTSGGFEHWCSQGASVDAADWGDGLDYWSNGMTYVQGGLTAPYCNGGETTAEDACANAY